MRVLIAGGGTGGHVIPALAIARELRDQYAANVRFVGTSRGLETKLVPESGFQLELVQVGQLNSVSLTTKLITVAGLPLALLRCFNLLRKFKPQVVVGVGGYAAGPATLAAILCGIPTLAFEPNAVPGMANQIIGPYVDTAAVNFETTLAYFRRGEVTGIPVRREFFAIAPKLTKQLHLLVFGGSQGASVLNDLLPRIAPSLLNTYPTLTIVHQAGGRHGESTQAAYTAAGVSSQRVRVQPYLDNMVEEVAAADVVLCRSGASTIAELAAAGRPALLVPFARAANDHQRRNADVLLHAGAARMIQEKELAPDKVFNALCELLDDPILRLNMGSVARTLAHADAAGKIGEIITKLGRPQKA
jgi:UDP-N-acetylglucosamine--N-acetylmuramyl-(pentapeptide) pyrophosphoryl-undecaprenol N-acetylglucosamine transferase